MKLNLLIAEDNEFSADAMTLLQQYFTVSSGNLNRDELLLQIKNSDLLWVRLRNLIDAEIMDAAPRLQAIVTNTTGLNHIDLAEAERRGISIYSLKGETDFLRSIRATAEHTLALTLALLRKLPQAMSQVRDGHWDRTPFRGREVHEKTVGIIGYGRLGRIVAAYFLALGANVVVTSLDLTPGSTIDTMPVLSLNELLSMADIISLHASYSAANEHMIRAEHFRKMKPGAIFINTARGELVDERSMIDALCSGQLGGAAIDVIPNEQSLTGLPAVFADYLHQADNLLMTPHIGGNTYESLEKTELFLARKICERFAVHSEPVHKNISSAS